MGSRRTIVREDSPREPALTSDGERYLDTAAQKILKLPPDKLVHVTALVGTFL
jgi:hypothetical protein